MPAGKQPSRFGQEFQSPLIRLIFPDAGQQIVYFAVTGEFFLEAQQQRGAFFVAASGQNAFRSFQSPAFALFRVIFARGFEQPESFLLARKFLFFSSVENLDALLVVLHRPQAACISSTVRQAEPPLAL